MGVFSKLKGIFYDEVIVEEPEEELSKVDKIVKKEVHIVLLLKLIIIF